MKKLFLLLVILLVCGLQLFCSLPSYAQQADLGAAAAAKAAAGREARSLGASVASAHVGPAGTFTTFDAPGAALVPFSGTAPTSINPAGTITGSYIDASSLGHGFLRARDGTFTSFDPAGSIFTQPAAINPAAVITGYYEDANFVAHGFLRGGDGTFTTFDAQGAINGTIPSSINPEGAITGYYYDTNVVAHGFLRAKDGNLTTFDDPDSGTGTTIFPGTMSGAISPEGGIAGTYTDASGVNHGFLRAGDGTFTTFDPPGQIDPFLLFAFLALPVVSRNPAGVITGAYFQPISGNPFGGNFQVFVRARDGTFTTFDAATYSPCCIWSFASGINPSGTITGYFNDGFNRNHGFVRNGDGTVITFDAPGAGTGFNQGTVPLGIDPAGVIIGYYTDNSNVHHGFLRMP